MESDTSTNPKQIKFPLKQIRTFEGDVAEVLQRQQESLASIQQAEARKKEVSITSAKEIPPSKQSGRVRTLLFGIASITLFALGAIGAWYAYIEYRAQITVPTINIPDNRFLSIDTEEKINVGESSRLDLISLITAAATSTTRGETRHISLITESDDGAESILPANKFFKILDTRAPGSLVRALDIPFMLGTFGTSTYLIFKLDSFENAYAGMLKWEEDMASDIGPIFATREFLRDISSTPVFIDITDRNKDIRSLEIDGQEVLLYSFFDNNMLIITDNIETLRVLVERLTLEKLSR